MISLLNVLLILLIIAIAAQICGRLFAYLGQPVVIGEIISGIILGPSLFGKLFPELSHAILPPNAIQFIGPFAQVGIIFYMFVVGLEVDLKSLKSGGRAIVAIAYGGIVIPFLLGIALALLLFKHVGDPSKDMKSFSLFFGMSLSITAFPVLARILEDTKLTQTYVGKIAIACAAVGDATAWCMLAAIVSIVKSEGHVFVPLLLTFLFTIIMFTAVRWLFDKFYKWHDRTKNSNENALPILLAGAMISAVATESFGIHAIFGAFIFGLILPHDSKLTVFTTERVQGILKVLFVPAFFAYTGLRTEISLVSGVEDWMICALIILTATAGKFGGSSLIARALGFKWREAGAIGSLMNSRGLVELIVLNVGLDLGIISPRLFTILVFMAVITTFMTTPITLWILGRGAFTLKSSGNADAWKNTSVHESLSGRINP